nr:transcription factor 7-like 2 [Lytechinus pictus]
MEVPPSSSLMLCVMPFTDMDPPLTFYFSFSLPPLQGQKMPVLHPAGAYPPSLAQLMMYQEQYSSGTPPPHVRGLEVDSKTGILRRSHSDISPYHPLSPSSLGSHPLEVYNMPWPGQPFYPLTSSALRSPYPPSLAVSPASMARLGPSPISSGPVPVGSLPHSLMHPMGSSQQHDAQQQSNDRHQKEKEKKLAAQEAKNKQQHIKKPLNAFMLYMKEMRASVVKECTLKESAAINQILGRRWHALSREEQAKYYELARKERQLHMQLYPGWSARDNYAIHGKKKKKKRDKSHGENPGEPSTPKKCRARFGVDQQDFWCKPCRRKKKCIRYISSDENDHGKDDDMDDDDMDDDQSDTSPSQPPPLDPDHPPPPPLSLSGVLPHSPLHRPHQDAVVSPKQNGIHPGPMSRVIAPHPSSSSSSGRSNGHSSSSQSNGEPPTSKGPSTSSLPVTSSAGMSSSSSSHKGSSHRDSHSASHLSLSSVSKPPETSRPLFSPHLHTTSSSGPSSSASISSSLSHSTLSIPSLSSQHISHHSQQSLAAQTSPTIVHLPHPSAASYPSLSSATSPMVMFSPQASLLGHHPTPPGMHEAFRPHLTNGFPPHGLLPMHHPQGIPPPPLISAAHSQQLRMPLSEMPQDLSVKSGTVTA